MITKFTGRLARVLDDEVRIEIGPFEYQVLVCESTRRLLQRRVGSDVTLHLTEYLEGGANASKLVPRRIGFETERELEFFELFCTVDKIGVKKALRALSRSIADIAAAIQRKDAKWLTTLPGIGPSGAEQIVATLHRKIEPYLDWRSPVDEPSVDEAQLPKRTKKAEPSATPASVPSPKLIDDVYQALLAMELPPAEARDRLDRLLQAQVEFRDVPEALTLMYRRPAESPR